MTPNNPFPDENDPPPAGVRQPASSQPSFGSPTPQPNPAGQMTESQIRTALNKFGPFVVETTAGETFRGLRVRIDLPNTVTFEDVDRTGVKHVHTVREIKRIDPVQQ